MLKNSFAIDENVLKEIKDAIDNGPTFGMSSFQVRAFVLGKNKVGSGDARNYRQVLLELSQKLDGLKRYRINLDRINIKIEMLNKRIEKEKNEHKKRLLECDLQDKFLDLESAEKLVKDAIKTCNEMYFYFKQLPSFTEEQFEQAEEQYWIERISNEAQLSVVSTGSIDLGTAQSLQQLGFDPLKTKLEIDQFNKNQILQLTSNKEKEE